MVPELWCDACLDRIQSEGEATVDELRASLLADGWSRRVVTPEDIAMTNADPQDGMVDLCVDCTDEDEVTP